jgi:hypothetical protein
MIHEVETAQPEFLVYVDVPTSWLAQVGSPQELGFLSWFQKYVQDKYQLDGIADIFGNETEYRWEKGRRNLPATFPIYGACIQAQGVVGGVRSSCRRSITANTEQPSTNL